MNNEFFEENQEPIYDYEDCANMIQEKTGLSREVIADVLNAEMWYLQREPAMMHQRCLEISGIREHEDAYFQA